jgi:hypothetical protein
MFRINQVHIPYRDKTLLKGNLFCADISDKDFVVDDNLELSKNCTTAVATLGSYRIAIPRSFWKFHSQEWQALFGELPPNWIDVIDSFEDASELSGVSPARGLAEILGSLKRGNDVLLFGEHLAMSGFVPAAIAKLCHPQAHIEKVIHPLRHGYGYIFSQIALGYLYGLHDAVRSD